MKVVTVVGARPQFIKLGPLSRALAETGATEIIVHTGQHYDEVMSSIFFDELDLRRPDYQLGVGSGPHGAQTGRMLESIEQVLLDERPDWTLVVGDTNSTLAGALAAAKLHLPVAHVEAGLRSFNRLMPEEINRLVADHVADLLFAPTDTAVRNLRAEGILEERIRLVGDVMFDASLHYGPKARERSTVLNDLKLISGDYVLVTVHRAENTDDVARLDVIVSALNDLAGEVTVVWPIHPRTRSALQRNGTGELRLGRLRMIDPVGYLDMVMLEMHARLIATDSGGVQKEAFFHRVPCVTLRDETEWTELVELGWNRLAPPDSSERVVRVLREALAAPPGSNGSPYGDGSSAALIVSSLIDGRDTTRTRK